MERRLEVDVAVVGGGGAGLAAAAEAAAAGARVVLLEKRAGLGGTTGIAVGSFTAAGTAFQKRIGVADDASAHAEDMALIAPGLEHRNDAGLRALLAHEAPATLSWLAGMGVEFHGPLPEPPNRVPRMHNVVPNAKSYIAVLHRRALSRGVKILLQHRVAALSRDHAGRVTGVKVEDSGGRVLTVGARKSVILAAGDYSGGEAIKREFLPASVACVPGVNPNATGDGHCLAREAGADLLNMDIVYGPEIRFVPPPRPAFSQVLPTTPWLARLMGSALGVLPKSVLNHIATRLLVTWQHPDRELFAAGAVLVNREGKRFTDELGDPELAIPRQSSGEAYIVFDARIAEIYSRWPHFISTAPGIAYAYLSDYERLRPDIVARADSLSALAAHIGAGAALEESIRRFNEVASGKAADEFGRSQFAGPLDRPPYYALGPARSWIVTAEGGVRINSRMQALDQSGRVIAGLYAAGCNGLGGMVLWGHGLHIAWAFTSGRLAGKYGAADFPSPQRNTDEGGRP